MASGSIQNNSTYGLYLPLPTKFPSLYNPCLPKSSKYLVSSYQWESYETGLGKLTKDQWLFLVPLKGLKGGRWHIIPHLAVYTTYVPLVYHLYILYIAFWGVIPPFRGTISTTIEKTLQTQDIWKTQMGLDVQERNDSSQRSSITMVIVVVKSPKDRIVCWDPFQMAYIFFVACKWGVILTTY